jgi:hypothetical protein
MAQRQTQEEKAAAEAAQQQPQHVEGQAQTAPEVAPNVQTAEERTAAAQSAAAARGDDPQPATRKVRANANVAGLAYGEEGDVPDDAELAGLLAAELVTDVAEEEKARKAEERRAKRRRAASDDADGDDGDDGEE